MFLKIISNNDKVPENKQTLNWQEHERRAFRTIVERRRRVGRLIDYHLGISDEGEPYASIVFTDNKATCMHICRAGTKYLLSGDSREPLVLTLDELLNSVDICRAENRVIGRQP